MNDGRPIAGDFDIAGDVGERKCVQFSTKIEFISAGFNVNASSSGNKWC
jgi:hypothetical protein